MKNDLGGLAVDRSIMLLHFLHHFFCYYLLSRLNPFFPDGLLVLRELNVEW